MPLFLVVVAKLLGSPKSFCINICISQELKSACDKWAIHGEEASVGQRICWQQKIKGRLGIVWIIISLVDFSNMVHEHSLIDLLLVSYGVRNFTSYRIVLISRVSEHLRKRHEKFKSHHRNSIVPVLSTSNVKPAEGLLKFSWFDFHHEAVMVPFECSRRYQISIKGWIFESLLIRSPVVNLGKVGF